LSRATGVRLGRTLCRRSNTHDSRTGGLTITSGRRGARWWRWYRASMPASNGAWHRRANAVVLVTFRELGIVRLDRPAPCVMGTARLAARRLRHAGNAKHALTCLCLACRASISVTSLLNG